MPEGEGLAASKPFPERSSPGHNPPGAGALWEGEHERDVNAAKNLKEYAVSSTVSACGEEGSRQGRMPLVKLPSKKQEVRAKDTDEWI